MSLSATDGHIKTLDELSDLGFACTGQNKASLPLWATQALSGKPAEALVQIEESLQQIPDSAETKLWWVRCQLDLGSVPVAALTGPLEEIVPKIREVPELRTLVSGTCVKMARALLQRKQPRLALSLLDHAIEFAKENATVTATQFRGLLDYFLATVRIELQAAPLRRESKSYLQYLAQKEQVLLQQLESVPRSSVAAVASEHIPPAKGTAKNRFNSKSILEEAARTSSSGDQDGAISGVEIPEGTTPTGSNSTQRALLFIICLLVTAGGLGASWLWVFSPDGAPISESLAMATSGAERQEPLIPLSITAPAGSNQVNAHDASLDSLGKRLQGLAFAKASPAAKAPDTATATNSKNPVADERQQVDKDALNPKSGRKLPNLRNEGDDELESLSGMPDAENAIHQNQVPSLNPDKFAKVQVEQVGSSPRKTQLEDVDPQQVHVGSDGRAYGPPKDADPYSEPGRKALDGSPLQSYNVENFEPPLLFRTLTATEVLTAPSLLSQSLARLDANTPVHVTKRMGQWLELVSSGGRVGYIYAQDATSATGK